jgi:hypothetical protein
MKHSLLPKWKTGIMPQILSKNQTNDRESLIGLLSVEMGLRAILLPCSKRSHSRHETQLVAKMEDRYNTTDPKQQIDKRQRVSDRVVEF